MVAELRMLRVIAVEQTANFHLHLYYFALFLRASTVAYANALSSQQSAGQESRSR